MDTSELVLLIIAFIVITLIILLVDIKNLYTYFSRIQVPELATPQFPYGSLDESPSANSRWSQHIGYLYQKACIKRYKYCGIYVYMKPCYLIIHPELCRKLLMSQNFRDKNFLPQPFAFESRLHHDKIYSVIMAKSKNKVLSLESIATKDVIPDIKDFLECLTVDLLVTIILNISAETGDDLYSEIFKFSKLLLKETWKPTFTEQFLERIPFGPTYLNRKKHSGESFRFFKKLVENEIRKSPEMRDDIEEISDTLVDIFRRSLQTILHVLYFCVFELSQETDIQDRLRNEIIKYKSEHTSDEQFDNIDEIKYLDEVLRETVRKYPPVSAMYETCIKEYSIPEFQLKIFEGSDVIIPVYNINHNPTNYLQHEEFKPGTFSEDNKDVSVVAFSDAFYHKLFRDECGFRYGGILLKIVLFSLIESYEFTTPTAFKNSGLKLSEYGFLLSTENKIAVKIKKVT